MNKQFSTQKEKIQFLVQNKTELIAFKKAVMKLSEPFGTSIFQAATIKILNTNYKDDLESGQIKRTIIANTYNWMDNHDDVHLDGVFSKSIGEKQDKIWHLHDHEQKITAKVGKPINIYEKNIDWTDVGVEKIGNTMSLFMDSNIIKEYNPIVFGQYLSKEVNQHSVGMVYVKLDLAVNDSEMKDEYVQWNKYINLIGNKEKAFIFFLHFYKILHCSKVISKMQITC